MFTIYIESLEVEAIIGILPHERKSPQLITVDCEIGYEKRQDEFVNYAEVVSVIESMLIAQKYALIEDALEELIAAIIGKFEQIKSIKLKLSKPQILNNCVVGVEAFRKI